MTPAPDNLPPLSLELTEEEWRLFEIAERQIKIAVPKISEQIRSHCAMAIVRRYFGLIAEVERHMEKERGYLNVTGGDRERAREFVKGSSMIEALAAEFAKVRADAIEASIERAEQACRYAFKYQEFSTDDAEYRKAWEVAASVCEGAIRANVERHVPDDCVAAAIRQASK